MIGPHQERTRRRALCAPLRLPRWRSWAAARTSPSAQGGRARRALTIATAAIVLLVPLEARAQWDIKEVVPYGTVVAQMDAAGAVEGVANAFDVDGKGGSALSAFTRPPGGLWSSGTPLAQRPVPLGADQLIAQVANSHGDVAILARRGSVDLVVYGRMSGSPVEPEEVAKGDAGALPVIQMNDAGDVLVAWGSRGRVRVAVREPDGVWADTVTLADIATTGGPLLDAALNEAGDAIVVWGRGPGDADSLRSAQHVAGGRWSKARAFGGRRPPVNVEVALDATGDGVVTWHTTNPELKRVSQKAWSSSTWDATRTLVLGRPILATDVGMDAIGNAVIVATARQTRAWRRTPRGGWVALAYPGDGYVNLTVNRFGYAVSVFGCEGLDTSVMRLPRGSWRSAGPLPSGPLACGPHQPTLNDAGDALLTWQVPQSNTAAPAFAAVLDGPSTAQIGSLVASGRTLHANLFAPGRLLVTLRRPTSRHIAAAFFVTSRASGAMRITIPAVAEGRRLGGTYVAKVETGSRNSGTRSRTMTLTVPRS